MSSTVILKAAGLNTSPNELSVPEGSLSEAKNVLIRRDGIIEQRRGFKLYGTATGSTLDRVKQLDVYRGRILRHVSNQLQYDSDGAGLFAGFTGSFTEADASLRMKFIESNGNLYFTSSNGIQKVSSKSAEGLAATTIVKAGATKAIDIVGSTIYTANSATGFLPQDSSVSYRVLWGYKDANANLVLGSPSQRELVYNYQITLMLQDYMRFVDVLDSFVNTGLTTAMINDKNYTSLLGLTSSSSTDNLRTNLIALSTKLDTDILYANSATAPLVLTAVPVIGTGICTITFASGTPSSYLSAGSKIYLSGFTVGTSGSINGQQVVVTAGASSITFNTTAVGTVTMGSQTITSGELRAIAQPPAVAIPPIHIDNMDCQAYMNSILNALRLMPITVITSADQLLLDVIGLTTTSTVSLKITIPKDIDSRYFYQIYRSSIFAASDAISLSDVTPNDELQLVYEAYPTTAEISTGTLTIIDITPDDFKGANLYTNNSTGEGILQSNNEPPFAKDVNRYRNTVFYANTRTKHSSLLNLLGVQNMITDYGLGTIPSITISTTSGSNTYTFVTGLQEKTNITTVADVADSLNGKYVLVHSSTTNYCFYFKTSGGADSPPVLAGYTNIKVPIATGATANTIASTLKDKISILIEEFTVSVLTNVVSVTVVAFGAIADATTNAGFTIAITQQGRGENLAAKQVLLSTNVSPAIAVDETARSLVRAINANATDSVYAFYLSGVYDVPGKMQIESRNLQTTDQFFLVANNTNTGNSFNPAITPDFQISAIGTGATPIITTSAPHGLLNLDFAVLGNTNSTPSVNGIYAITYINTTQFSITPTAPVTIAGTLGTVTSTTNTVVSENETKPNRVYYSKRYQPEAVPATNYFDVGAEDKAILRIFPLRDSLFVFKEDGLYRISGETAPFQLNLFDSSFIVTAPDSVTVSNNVIFGWTTQGIQSLTEGGAQVVSRNIDNQILKLGSSNYINFRTVTWGVGYESDNSYIVFTVTNTDDTVATKGFRFSTLTQTWTTYEKTNTCGIVSNADDKLYLGAGDINYIEQERKLFDRTDFADREYTNTLGNGFLNTPVTFKMSSIANMAVGDVIVQDQTVTAYNFNSLLEKLDSDNQITQNNFLSTLILINGANPRDSILALATKLDNDTSIIASNFYDSIGTYTGTITANTSGTSTIITSATHKLVNNRKILITGSNSTPNIDGEYTVTYLSPNTFSIPVSVKIPGTTGSWQTLGSDFADLQTCYNTIINTLNLDAGVSFNNYQTIVNTTQLEVIISAIDSGIKSVTVNQPLQFLTGAITVYKSIPTSLVYSPITMGDPLMLKHLRESTLMFQTRNITSAILSFATDLLPELIPVTFNLDGNGIFGTNNFGSGFFGGNSNSAPFRTFIPRQCQRCRFMVIKVEHSIAREDYRLLGCSITGEVGQSTRTYR